MLMGDADELADLLTDADLVDEDGLVEMVNVPPRVTGLRFWIHAYQNLYNRAKHGPRLKVFQGARPPDDPIVVTVPASDGEEPRVVGELKIAPHELAAVVEFVKTRRTPLLRYWTDPLYAATDLLDDLKPACAE